MAIAQKVMWTALPNGITPGSGGKKIRLSVFVSPTLLDSGMPTRLDHFPDFSAGPGNNWASKVNGLEFRVEVMNNLDPLMSDSPIVVGEFVPASKASPELWDALFKPDGRVPSSKPALPSAMKINTYSVNDVIKRVQDQYIAVAANPALVSKLPAVDKMVTPPGLASSPIMRLIPSNMRPPSVRVVALAADKDPAVEEFEDFHKPFEPPDTSAQAAGGTPTGTRPRPLRPKMDFQRALSAIGEFPAMLAGLGMVIDLDVPYSAALRSGRRIRVVPTTPVTGSQSGWTAYDISLGLADRTGALTVRSFTTRARGREIKSGYMVMRTPSAPSKSPTSIATVDADFAGLALKATAVSAAKAIKEVLLARQNITSSAISPGVAVDVARPIKGTVSPSTTYQPMGLPGLGPSTLSLVRNDVKASLTARLTDAAAKEAYLKANQDKLVLHYAEDLTRGYRVDVWDSVTKKWHKLCARKGEYEIGGAAVRFKDGRATLAVDGATSFEDEGWLQTALVSDPNKKSETSVPSEVWLHQHMFDWTGWSLAVPRPGAAISQPDGKGNTSMIRKSTGPDGTVHDIGQWVDPDYPLWTYFSVPDGSLPRKRFGTTYRFRARAVDLAGRSVTFNAGAVTSDPGGTGDTNALVSDKVINRRSDPVKAPVIVITERTKPGESPAVLVVRSNYDTPPASIPPTSRHITPPRSSVEMAEELGGLDNALLPGKPLDPTLWSMLDARDRYQFDDETASEGGVSASGVSAMVLGPTLPQATIEPNLPPILPGQLRKKAAYVPKVYKQQAPAKMIENPDGTLPYLPDMLSRGATLTGLPGTPATTSGVRLTAAAVSTTPTPGTMAKTAAIRVPTITGSTETVKTIMVDFDRSGQKWYDKRSFRLVVKGIEALDTRLAAHAVPTAPKWDATARTLTVELAKAERVTVQLSSFTNPADLNLMEVYEWGTRPFVQRTTVKRLVGLRQMALPSAVALPTAVKTTMPAATKALVSLSIIGRNWTITPHDTLTLIHPVRQPLILPNFTSRARVNRSKGDTFGVLWDIMPIHGKSTAKLDVEARWHENVDDSSDGVPKWKDPKGTDTSVAKREKVFNVTVAPADTSVLGLGVKVVPKPAFTPIKALATDARANAQRHFFGDTKHRLIYYKATATSRFPEFFADDPNAVFTRVSPETGLHVPSSARPAAPNIAYIVPTYGWTRTATSSKRSAGGLRVYLERPWFTSGDNEQLAVVCTPGHGTATKWHTQWGEDPIWSSAGSLPFTKANVVSFGLRSGVVQGLRIAEDGSTVTLGLYDVAFDADRDMWYADLQINPGGAYFPFVKLALARYQKYSLPGLELSSIVMADFAQLAPERTAGIAWEKTALATKLDITVSGQSYAASHVSKFHHGKRATVTVQLEEQSASHPSGWLPVGDTETELARQAVPAYLLLAGATYTTWKGTLVMPRVTAGKTYRLIVREYEWFHSADTPPSTVGTIPQTPRLVYADAMPLVLP